jgi:hypothetical protein
MFPSIMDHVYNGNLIRSLPTDIVAILVYVYDVPIIVNPPTKSSECIYPCC